MNRTAVSIVLLVLTAATTAVAGPLTGYGAGTVAFTYAQFPFGDYQGTFHAQGPAGGAGDFIAPGDTAGCGGVAGEVSDGGMLVAYGAVRRQDGGLDLAIVTVYDTAGPIAAGNRFDVDVTGPVCLFWYLEDVTGIALPDDLTNVDWQSLIDTVVAAHKFVSVTGAVTVTALDGDVLTGTFAGNMDDLQDPSLVITVHNGSYALSGGFVGNRRLNLGQLKALYR